MAKNSGKYNDSEYWENRIANETWRTYNSVEEKNRALIDMYDKTAGAIKKELYTLAEMSEEQGGFTRTQQYRFNKLLGQRGYIFSEVEKLGKKVDKYAVDEMLKAGGSVYGNVMDALGVDNFKLPNKKIMEQMLRSPWHGSFFSERLWNDMGKLERNLNGVINDGVSTGKTVTEMAVQLANTMNKDFNYAHMLVRSETINYMNRSALQGYKDAGIKIVQWWAAKDERTCEICGVHHTEKYDIEKAPNLPCHPGCRCTWLPVISYKKDKNINIPEFSNKNNKAPSVKELETKAIKNLGVRKADFTGIDIQIAQKIINTLSDAQNKLPEIKGKIVEIQRIKGRGLMAIGTNDNDEFIFKINIDALSSIESINAQFVKMINIGYFAKGSSLETAPYHEIGHLLEGMYIMDTLPLELQEAAWNNCTAAENILRMASNVCYSDADKYKQVISNISAYANETNSEALAECIELELSGRGNNFTATVLKILRRK